MTISSKRNSCAKLNSQEVESLVKTYNFNYIDAILTFCEENKIEMESVGKLISKPLKEKLKYDAIQLNFLKKNHKSKTSAMISRGELIHYKIQAANA